MTTLRCARYTAGTFMTAALLVFMWLWHLCFHLKNRSSHHYSSPRGLVLQQKSGILIHVLLGERLWREALREGWDFSVVYSFKQDLAGFSSFICALHAAPST